MIFWLKITASTRTGADWSALLGLISNLWQTNVNSEMPTNLIMNLMDGVWITPGGGEIRMSNTTVHTGTHVGTALNDASACAVANWRVDKYYRGGHPRSYWPGLLSSEIVNGSTLDQTALTRFQNMFGAWRTGINSLTSGGITAVQLGTLSFQTHTADGTPIWRDPPEFWPYNGVACRSILGTQRRRLVA